MKKTYLTLDEKMDLLLERIFQGVLDEFDSKYSEEELEVMDGQMYFDKAREEKLGVEGYEEVTMLELYDMSNEDIVTVHNLIYGDTETLEEINQL